MTSKRANDANLDGLLKRALSDNLPPDVAAGMRDRFARFRERTRPRERREASRAPLFRKTAWAALSLLTLVSGGLLQGRGSRNPLSDGISLVKTRLAVSGQLAAAESMSCSVHVRRAEGTAFDYEITWRAGSPAEVHLKGPEESLPGEFRPGEPPEISDAQVAAVASVSTPSALGKRLSGGWRFIGTSREAGCEIGAYAIPAGAGAANLEFAIDMCTYLPVRIAGTGGPGRSPGSPANFSWEATFRF